MRRFGRQYEITFGSRGSELKKISELRCSFTIEKSNEKTANSAVFQIYNLNEDSRQNFAVENAIVIFKAGYKENIVGLFAGDIEKVEHIVNGADIITKITAGDGKEALKTSTISKSYAKGTSLKSVITDVIGSFQNVSFSQVLDNVIPAGAELLTGGAFEGQSDGILEQLLGSYGLNYSIQDEELVIAGNDALNTTDIQVINSATGLIGSPSKTDKGISVKTLLEPTLRPNSIVNMDSLNIKGNYKLTKVLFEGDNFDIPWYSTFEAEVVNA